MSRKKQDSRRHGGGARIAAAIVLLSLAACGGPRRPPLRPAAERPVALALRPSRETQRCLADLSRDGIRYSALPDRDFGGGCSSAGAVRLVDIGVPVTNVTAMRCGLAHAFTAWVRNAVAPAARQLLGSDLVRVESLGSYACRAVVGVSGAGAMRMSGHASANAVDVSGFVLADGRRVTILSGWRSPDPSVRAFLAAIHISACRRFGTVLSPDYNAAHANHLHLEDNAARLCR